MPRRRKFYKCDFFVFTKRTTDSHLCTHSQEPCPKLIPVFKSCVFLCMWGGFKEGGKQRRREAGRGRKAQRLGLGPMACKQGACPGLSRVVRKLPRILQLLPFFSLALPPSPCPLLPLPCSSPPPFLSPCPPTPLILLLPSSRQGCFSVMFSVRLTSDKDPGNGRQLSRPTRASPIRFSWRFSGLAQTGSEHCSGELSRTWGGFGDIAADKIVKSH